MRAHGLRTELPVCSTLVPTPTQTPLTKQLCRVPSAGSRTPPRQWQPARCGPCALVFFNNTTRLIDTLRVVSSQVTLRLC
eukprot:349801-Chlamydomonas_euryale.AAC.19